MFFFATRFYREKAKGNTQRILIRALLDHLPAAILIRDSEGKTILTNQMYLDDFDVQESSSEKVSLDDFDQKTSIAMGPKGKTYLSSKFSLRDEGQRTLLIGELITDITDLTKQQLELFEARENARNAERIKSDFLAKMSHEIRTPLHGVIGLSDLLIDGPLSSEQRENAETLRDCAKSLLSIVGNILDFSKLEAGKTVVQSHPLDIRLIIDQVEKTTATLAKRKGLHFSVDQSGLSHFHFVGDSGKICQILHNLLSNAVKFTASGFVNITFRTLEDEPDAQTLFVEVKDSGIGVQEASRNQIFECFFQENRDTSQSGTGLGLAIAKNLVTMMNGKIGVSSQPHRGSCFWFSLKLRKSPTPNQQLPLFSEVSIPALMNERILIVDDSPVNRSLCVKMLQNAGYTVQAVTNGSDAVKAFQPFSFDLVLMDCQMPVMDGYTATQIIKSAKTTDVPVIAMTASATPEEINRIFLSGMDDYIFKPFSRDHLMSLVSSWIKRSKTEKPHNRFQSNSLTLNN